MDDNEELIVTLSEHRMFGWLFHVYSAQQVEGEGLLLMGVPRVKQEIVTLAGTITDQALMKDFSKEKTTRAFLQNVKPEIIDRFIRPRIELTNRRIVEAAQKGGIPIFLRPDISFKVLYEKLRLEVVPSPAECLFNFVKDENGLRYFISLICEGKEISLRQKPGVILSEKPCLILTGKEIRYVEQIEAKKLTPFFDKSHIAVPAQSEETYLKNFVCKTMLSYQVKIEGIPVREIQPEKKAFLTLERDFHRKAVCILSFQYGDAPRIYPDNPKKKTVEIEESDGCPSIRLYKRDTDWEGRLIRHLEAEGLCYNGSNHFHAAETDGEYQLIEWLNRQTNDSLSAFTIENKLERAFFIRSVSVQTGLEAKPDWFELHIEVRIGAYTLPFHCFRNHILEKNNEYILPDGTVFILPGEWFEKYYDILYYAREKEGSLLVRKAHASLLEHSIGKDLPDEKLEAVSHILEIPVERPPLPPLKETTLRTYQMEGFYWLEHLYKNGFGGCLADDMGLGKTLQAITLLQHIYAGDTSQAALVVAPTSLLHNWQNELARFAPRLRTLIYAKDKRLRSGKADEIEQTFSPYQVIITSYGLLRNDIEYLREYTFRMIILDESQYIKNPASQVYRAVEQLDSPHRLALTGTPLENSLEDLWAQFNFLNEGLLGDLPSFKRNFAQPIAREKDQGQEELLKRLISPFLLRRTKEEVAPELPPLIQETIFCDMTEAQQKQYDTEKNRIRNMLLEAMENPELPHNNFIALEGLNKLRQLANHPKLVDAAYAEDSGKFDQVILSFENLKARRHKALIFSSYVKYLKLLAARFDEEGWQYALLTGETLRREEEIRRFTENNDVGAFFISLKAGSTGLNLTAADYVFILDPWWNPATEMQALSRAHRIGQKKNVIAYRFISTETVEEKILRLQESKTALYETFIGNNNPLSQFSWADIKELLN
ncbi:MAG: DEAD/DEAH box helicase [Tannerellaceae bacterium]|jgi:superfamily II DNA or RNA helicase|nr:DEAD/DEAH box helicase [Tannerellaceae bacterium]